MCCVLCIAIIMCLIGMEAPSIASNGCFIQNEYKNLIEIDYCAVHFTQCCMHTIVHTYSSCRCLSFLYKPEIQSLQQYQYSEHSCFFQQTLNVCDHLQIIDHKQVEDRSEHHEDCSSSLHSLRVLHSQYGTGHDTKQVMERDGTQGPARDGGI